MRMADLRARAVEARKARKTAPGPMGQMRAVIRARWAGMTRRQLRCVKGGRHRGDVWRLAERMPRLVLDLIARELARGEVVDIPGVGRLYTRVGGASTALRGTDRVNRPIAPRRVVACRFSKALAREVGDGTRWSLRFRAAARLKRVVRGSS